MKLAKKLENLLSAAAFAEEGEFETAREIVAENAVDSGKKPSVDDIRLGTPPVRTGRLAPKS